MYRDDQKNTGRKEFKKRLEFLRMLADAETGKFDVVVCRDLSRPRGRHHPHDARHRGASRLGIKIQYYVDDTEQRLDTWVDKTMLAIKSGAAEGERDAISSRTREALQLKAQQALCVGGRCYGYDLMPILEGSVKKRTEYAISPKEAPVVRGIFERYARGEGLKSIAKELNRRGVPAPRTGTGSWSPTSIRPMLQRERYRGVIEWGRKHKTYKGGTKIRIRREPSVVIEAEHLRIVDEATWTAVQERFAHQRRLTGKAGPLAPTTHLLSGLAKCGICGGSVSAESKKWGTKVVKVYCCKKHRQSGAAACSNKARRPVSSVDAALLSWVENVALTET